MKVMDCSLFHEKGGLEGLLQRLRTSLFMSSSWQKEQQAQEAFILRMRKRLGNNYTLVRNAALPELDIPIPMVLVGPSGIWAIYASPVKGIFRAKEEAWLMLDDRSRRYRPAQPNLITRALLIARAVQTYLNRQGFPLAEVSPALYLSDPGVHVDANQPAVRLVRNETLDRFVTTITQSTAQFDSNQVFEIVRLLSKPPTERPKEPSEPWWAKGWRLGPLKMVAWQWLVLVVMFLFEICLIGGAFYLIWTTQ